MANCWAIAGLLVCLLLAGQGSQDLGLHLIQRFQVRGLLLFDLQDVVAELGLDHIGDLARLQREGCCFKRRHGDPALNHAQLAARILAARVIGVGLGQSGKICAAFDLLQQVFGLLLGRRVGLGVRVGRHLDQDVPYLYFLGHLKILLMCLVVLLHLLVGHRRRATRHVGLVQGDVGQLARLGNRVLVARRILLEKCLQLGVRGIDLLAQIFGVDHRVVELDLGCLLAIGVAHFLVGDGDAAGHHGFQTVDLDFFLDLGFEVLDRGVEVVHTKLA